MPGLVRADVTKVNAFLLISSKLVPRKPAQHGGVLQLLDEKGSRGRHTDSQYRDDTRVVRQAAVDPLAARPSSRTPAGCGRQFKDLD
jgi:hypothetical protein